MLIDTHCHLYHAKFDADREAVVARAAAVCSAILLPNIDLESLGPLNALARAHPTLCYPMAGLHPCDVPAEYEALLPRLEAELATGRYHGVGETGLDLYWDKTTLARQTASLNAHLAWAKRYHLPIVLHSRDAFEETLACVEAAQDGTLTGVFHCFTGTADEGRRAIAAGCYLGLGGVLTYKTSPLPEAVRALDPAYLLLETDAPFLPPVPYRGQRNEPAYTQRVAHKLAETLGLTYAEVAELTSANARRLFTRLPLTAPAGAGRAG